MKILCHENLELYGIDRIFDLDHNCLNILYGPTLLLAMATGKSKKKQKPVPAILEELDRILYEGKWNEVNSTLKKIGKKATVPEVISPFLKALEYLEALTKESSGRVKTSEIKQLLGSALDHCKSEETGVIRTMINIKLGQLLWIEDEVKLAVSRIPRLGATRADTMPIHTNKVLMEGQLYLALCHQVLFEGRQGEPAVAVNAYEECIRLAMESAVAAKSLGLSVHPAVYHAIHTALERGPVLALQLGDHVRAVSFFRRVLLVRDDHMIPQVRQMCATSLTSSLLFLSSPSSYRPFTFSPNVYSPSQLAEEAILASFFSKMFIGSIQDTRVDDVSVIFDMMTLVLSDAKLYGVLVQNLEDAMQFSLLGNHLWLQFALALVCNNQLQQAEAVFEECVRIFPTDLSTVLTAANFVLESARKPGLCLKWGETVQKVSKDHYLEPSLYAMLGRAQASLADKENVFAKRRALHKKSLQYFREAVRLDPQNAEFSFLLALNLAVARDLSGSRTQVQHALSLCHDHTGCLHLLSLLLSADKQYAEALKICELALQQEPENLNLLYTKIRLQVSTLGAHSALQTCKVALKVWAKLYAEEGSGLLSAVTQDQRSLSDIPLKTSDRDVSHAVSPDIASDAGSSVFSTSPVQALNLPSVLQAQLWCVTAEVFIEAEKLSDATSCVHEAQYLAAYLPMVSVTHGKVLECEKLPEVAVDQYNNALVLQPYNSVALAQLGRLMHLTGKNEQAEKYLRESMAIDKLNPESWYWLGKVFAAQGEHERAADCFKTALDVESTTPVQTFTAALHSNLLLAI